jgi:hypothetical protein
LLGVGGTSVQFHSHFLSQSSGNDASGSATVSEEGRANVFNLQPADDSERCYLALHAAGWSIGDAAFVGSDGSRHWLVSGSNGENLIRAEGVTRDEAWRKALEQARAVGMIG